MTRPASLFVFEITPRVLVDVTLHGQSYTAGETPTLRYSIDDYVTRPTDTPALDPYEVALAKPLNIEQSAFSISDGWLELGGLASVSGGAIELSNADGDLDGWASLSIDGAQWTVRMIEFEWIEGRGWRPEPLADAEIWGEGIAKGRPRFTGRLVTVEISDPSGVLDVDLQRIKFLGLGGALVGETAGNVGIVQDDAGALDGTVAALTLIMLARIDAFDGGWIACKGAQALAPYFVRAHTTGDVRCKLRSASANVNCDAVYPVGEWRWIVLRFGSDLAEVFTAERDGSNWTAGETAALTGPLKALAEPFALFNDKDSAGDYSGALAHIRLYFSALSTATIQAQIGRLLDMDAKVDTDDLLLNIPCDDRFGDYASDLGTNRLDATLTNLTWATTGTGRGDLAGKPMPLAMGPARHVPLTQVDEIADGRIFLCSWRSIQKVRFIFAGYVGLVGPFSLQAAASMRFDADRQLIIDSAGTGRLDGLVPAQQITITGTSSNNGTFTVDQDQVTPDGVRVEEALVNESPASTTIVSVSSAWSVYDAGSATSPTLTKVTGGFDGELTAIVEGDDAGANGYAETLEEQLDVVTTEMGPLLAPSKLDYPGMTAAERDTACDYYLPVPSAVPDEDTRSTSALDVVRELLAAVQGYVLPLSNDSIDFGAIDFDDASDPVADFVMDGSGGAGDGVVLELSRVDLGAPPLEVRVGYAKHHGGDPGSDVVAAAWQQRVEFAREPFRWAPVDVADPDDWPLARDSSVIETPLSHQADADSQKLTRATASEAAVFTATLDPLIDSLAVGSKIRVYYDRHGFDAGVVCWVIGLVKVAATLTVKVDLAVP